jgi:hypothetical protein
MKKIILALSLISSAYASAASFICSSMYDRFAGQYEIKGHFTGNNFLVAKNVVITSVRVVGFPTLENVAIKMQTDRDYAGNALFNYETYPEHRNWNRFVTGIFFEAKKTPNPNELSGYNFWYHGREEHSTIGKYRVYESPKFSMRCNVQR